MLKRLIDQKTRIADQAWLDPETVARVELTSEEASHPIESALNSVGSGWRAASEGEQIVRLFFSKPIQLRRIYVRVDEEHQSRTQQFVLRWSPDQGRSYREIVRQQFTFSPPGTSREVEDYSVTLDEVTVLELQILPDLDRRTGCASLQELRLG